MAETPLIEIVRAAVGEVAPAELPDVDRVARDYARAPAAARRAGRANGNGPGVALLAVAVSADLCRQPLVTGPRSRLAGWWGRLRHRGRPDLDRPPPPVAEPDAARMEAAAVVTARERGASDEVAAAIGAALARHWPRRT